MHVHKEQGQTLDSLWQEGAWPGVLKPLLGCKLNHSWQAVAVVDCPLLPPWCAALRAERCYHQHCWSGLTREFANVPLWTLVGYMHRSRRSWWAVTLEAGRGRQAGCATQVLQPATACVQCRCVQPTPTCRLPVVEGTLSYAMHVCLALHW